MKKNKDWKNKTNNQELIDTKELFTLLNPETLKIRKTNHELLKPLLTHRWLKKLLSLQLQSTIGLTQLLDVDLIKYKIILSKLPCKGRPALDNVTKVRFMARCWRS